MTKMQSLPKFAKVYQSLPKFAKVWLEKKQHNFVFIKYDYDENFCWSLCHIRQPWCFQSLKNNTICHGLPQFKKQQYIFCLTKHHNLPQFEKHYIFGSNNFDCLPKFAKVCQSLTKFDWKKSNNHALIGRKFDIFG